MDEYRKLKERDQARFLTISGRTVITTKAERLGKRKAIQCLKEEQSYRTGCLLRHRQPRLVLVVDSKMNKDLEVTLFLSSLRGIQQSQPNKTNPEILGVLVMQFTWVTFSGQKRESRR